MSRRLRNPGWTIAVGRLPVFTRNESSDRKSEIIPRNLVNVVCPEIFRSLIDYFIISDRHRPKTLMNPLWCNFLEDIFQQLTDTELSEKVRYRTEVDRSVHFRFAQHWKFYKYILFRYYYYWLLHLICSDFHYVLNKLFYYKNLARPRASLSGLCQL